MAIKIAGTTVIDDSRNVNNIGTIKGLTYPSADGTTGQFMKTDGAGNLAFQTVQTDPTLATLTKSFASGETASITLSSAITTAPVVSVIKEVPQTGVSSKGSWDVASDGANYIRHDTAYNTTLTPSTIGFNTNLTIDTNKEYFANLTNERAVRFNNDGTRMYVVDRATINLREYSLSTAYDPSTATLLNSIDNYLGSTSITGFDIKPDGTKMWFLIDSTDTVLEYDLSPAWNVSGTHQTYPNATQVLPGNPAQPWQLQFSSDGTKLFTDAIGNDAIYEYALSTAWDITSVSYTTSFSYAAQTNTIIPFVFSNDGTKLFLLSYTSTDVLYEYELSTGWDVSTASYTGNTFTIGSGETTSIWFEENGSILFTTDAQAHRVKYYDVATTNALILGSGSFAAGDVGKTIEGNGGKAVLTAADGSYAEVTAFTDSSTIASGDWEMFGTTANAAKGLELSSISSGFQTPDKWSYDGVLLNLEDSNVTTSPTISNAATSINFKPDGTVLYVSTYAEDRIYQIALAAPYDLTNASADGNFYLGSQNGAPYDVTFKPDGTVMFMLGSNHNIYAYALSTAWDVTSASFTNSQLIPSAGTSSLHLKFKPDGTKLFVTYNSSDDIQELDLGTAWDITTLSHVRKFSFGSQSTSPRGFYITEDGLRLQVQFVDGDKVHEYNLSSPWSLLNASYSGKFIQSVADSSIGSEPESFAYSADGTKVFTVDQGGNARVYQWSSGELFGPTNSYEVAVTNSGGQIDTTTWLDINTMAADESVGDGTVSYAVSTDGRTTWSVIKEGTGVRPIARNNSGTWQYNSDTGNPDAWDVSEATYIRDLNTTPSDQGQAIFFKPDGTQYYVLEKDAQRVYKHSLSTPWDVSTASSFEALFYTGSQDNAPTGLFFKPDGTKMYLVGQQQARIYEYDLSTAWDITTSTFNQSYNMSELSQPASIIFKPDGTQFYVNNNNGYVYSYTLSTPWDVSSSDFNNNKITSTGTNEGNPRGLFFKSDGTKMYSLGFQRDTINEWDLSTAWDISTASLNTNTLATGGTSGTGLFFNSDGDRLYTIDEGTDRIRQYSIGTYAFSTTAVWANSYTNQELSALRQALSSSLANRMDKTQLDAVTDPNHFTLGDSLDLMIGLYLGSASTNVPSSDGVTISYDAEVLNQGAVLGTDYDFDMPTTTKVRVTSNAAQNLKIRVV